MNNEFTNLLPQSRQKTVALDYVLRLGVVASVLITALTLIAAILLIPTYIFLESNIHVKETRLSEIEATLAVADEATLAARLSMLSKSADTLIALARSASASDIIGKILDIMRPGVTLSGFTYAPSEADAGTIAISGIAATRNSLRNYQLALQGSPFIKSASLPVSAYAGDNNIGFTIKVVLTP